MRKRTIKNKRAGAREGRCAGEERGTIGGKDPLKDTAPPLSPGSPAKPERGARHAAATKTTGERNRTMKGQ
jgi:hypothetical protein